MAPRAASKAKPAAKAANDPAEEVVPEPASRIVMQIPQVLNAGLLASVYICGAQALGGAFAKSDLTVVPVNWLEAFCAITIFFWATKNFADDYRAFAGKPDPAFNLPFTLLFSALAYATLAVAASSLDNAYASVRGLMVYFLVLSVWSLTSFVRRKKFSKQEDQDPERMQLRLEWFFLYLVASLLIAVIIEFKTGCITTLAAMGVWAIYVYDAIRSKTFATNYDKPA